MDDRFDGSVQISKDGMSIADVIDRLLRPRPKGSNAAQGQGEGSGGFALPDMDAVAVMRSNGVEPLSLCSQGPSGWLFRAQEIRLNRPAMVRIIEGASWCSDTYELWERSSHDRLVGLRYAFDIGDRRAIVYENFSGSLLTCEASVTGLSPSARLNVFYQIVDLACHAIETQGIVPVFGPDGVMISAAGKVGVLWLSSAGRADDTAGGVQLAACVASLRQIHELLCHNHETTSATGADAPRLSSAEKCLARLSHVLGEGTPSGAIDDPRMILEEINSFRTIRLKYQAEALFRGTGGEDDRDMPLLSKEMLRGLASCIVLGLIFALSICLIPWPATAQSHPTAAVATPVAQETPPPAALPDEIAQSEFGIDLDGRAYGEWGQLSGEELLVNIRSYIEEEGGGDIDAHVFYQERMRDAGRLDELKAWYGDRSGKTPSVVLDFLTVRLLPSAEDRASGYAEIVRAYPSFARGHAALGAVEANRGDYYDAMQHYETALYHEPGNAMFHADLAKVQMLAGGTSELASSRSSLTRLVSEYPDSIYCRVLLLACTSLLEPTHPTDEIDHLLVTYPEYERLVSKLLPAKSPR